jgi:hypothetical protein
MRRRRRLSAFSGSIDAPRAKERRSGVPGDLEERRSGVPGDLEERRSGVPGDRDARQTPLPLTPVRPVGPRLRASLVTHAALGNGLKLKSFALELLFLKPGEFHQRVERGELIRRGRRSGPTHDERGPRRLVLDGHPHRLVAACEEPASRLHIRSIDAHVWTALYAKAVGAADTNPQDR